VKRRTRLEVGRRHRTYEEAALILGAMEAGAIFSRRTTAQLLHLRYRQVAWAELQAMVKIIRYLKNAQKLESSKSSRPPRGVTAGNPIPHHD
jgi:anthranilate phosphoribosyltransferase